MLRKVANRFLGSRKPTTLGRKPAQRQLAVEQLENRLVPSTFYPPSFTSVGSGPQLLAAGRFNTNNDYHQDVAVTNSNGTYSVLLGDGNGHLTRKGTYDLPGATNTEGIVAGDFSGHGDGTNDLNKRAWNRSPCDFTFRSSLAGVVR
jgi:FG-GAP-like repeat